MHFLEWKYVNFDWDFTEVCSQRSNNNIQIMAWRRPGDKPLSEPKMVRLLTHIGVTRPQWVNYTHTRVLTSIHLWRWVSAKGHLQNFYGLLIQHHLNFHIWERCSFFSVGEGYFARNFKKPLEIPHRLYYPLILLKRSQILKKKVFVYISFDCHWGPKCTQQETQNALNRKLCLSTHAKDCTLKC